MTSFNPIPLLHNPKFATPGGFTIRRYTVAVDDHGMMTKDYEDIPAQGTIVPGAALGLRSRATNIGGFSRTPEAEMQGNSIMVFTDTAIQTGETSKSKIADDIIYRNKIWQVSNLVDWLDWGFNVAQAVLQNPTGDEEGAEDA